jgi:hypothetical protein
LHTAEYGLDKIEVAIKEIWGLQCHNVKTHAYRELQAAILFRHPNIVLFHEVAIPNPNSAIIVMGILSPLPPLPFLCDSHPRLHLLFPPFPLLPFPFSLSSLLFLP